MKLTWYGNAPINNYAHYKKSTEEREARLELLQFQLEELTELNLEQQTWEQVVSEHLQLANAEQSILQAQQVLDFLSGEQEANAITLLQQANMALEKISGVFPHTQQLPNS